MALDPASAEAYKILASQGVPVNADNLNRVLGHLYAVRSGREQKDQLNWDEILSRGMIQQEPLAPLAQKQATSSNTGGDIESAEAMPDNEGMEGEVDPALQAEMQGEMMDEIRSRGIGPGQAPMMGGQAPTGDSSSLLAIILTALGLAGGAYAGGRHLLNKSSGTVQPSGQANSMGAAQGRGAAIQAQVAKSKAKAGGRKGGVSGKIGPGMNLSPAASGNKVKTGGIRPGVNLSPAASGNKIPQTMQGGDFGTTGTIEKANKAKSRSNKANTTNEFEPAKASGKVLKKSIRRGLRRIH